MNNSMVNPSTGEIVEMAPMTAEQVLAQTNLIHQVMNASMKSGQHYGLIPGCGDKPTLLKPGAEKLSQVFRLRPIIKEDGNDVKIVDLGGGHREYIVYCHIFNAAGVELSTGVGSCSTMESKYRYRGGQKTPTGQPVPKEYWNLRKEHRMDEAKALIGGDGFGTAKIDGVWQICEIGEKMENPDLADVYNTCLKMGKKRAYVDGILSATGASDVFTQDLEDLNEDLHAAAGNGKAATPASEPDQAPGEDKAKGWKAMPAGFPGKCATCGGEIKKGEPIIYVSATKKAHHPACAEKAGIVPATAPAEAAQ